MTASERPPPRVGRRAAAAEWNLARVAKSARDGVVEGWRRLPPEVRRTWLTVLVAGLAFCLLLDVALVTATQRLSAAGSLAWEPDVIRRVAALPWLTLFDAMWIDAFGSSAMIVPVLVAASVLLARAGRATEAIQVVAAYAGARVLMHAGWALWARPRPDLIAGERLHPPGGLHSFPSGHLLQVVSIYGFLLYLAVRSSPSLGERILGWAAFALFTGVVGVGRVRLGSHWPTDVISAALLGAAWLGVLVSAARVTKRAEHRTHPVARP